MSTTERREAPLRERLHWIVCGDNDLGEEERHAVREAIALLDGEVGREGADAERFRTMARERGYRLEDYRKLRDDRIAALTRAGMWPPKLRKLETVQPLRAARPEGEEVGS